MNLKCAAQIINNLVYAGVQDFVCCAGARNAPIVEVLSRSKGLHVTSFYEERSASFFALGLSQASSNPVVVCMTSGTAVAETLPAVIEAFYTKTPLIILSADRPQKYRGSGAPQAIEQIGIFSSYIEKTIDLDPENIENFSWQQIKSASQKGPLHINICFDEPLIDGPVPTLDFRHKVPEHLDDVSEIKKQNIKSELKAEVSDASLNKINDFLKKSQRPIILLSKFKPTQNICHFLNSVKVPVFVESTCDIDLQNENLMLSHELLLKNRNFQNKIDSVIRIGRVPTTRFWRDLEGQLNQIPVLSISDLPFSGLSREKDLPLSLLQFEKCIAVGDVFQLAWPPAELADIKNKNQELLKIQSVLLKKYPESEPALINNLAKQLSRDDLFFVGNSLPIREWDQFAFSYFKLPALANRGANGIDGLASTFAGHLQKSHKQSGVCLIGDLSLKYDFAGLELLRKINKKALLVVVNNKGGKIFSRIFKNNLFENNHNDSFEYLAKYFGFEYFTNASLSAVTNSQQTILELIPDADQTNEFWNEWDQLWQ